MGGQIQEGEALLLSPLLSLLLSLLHSEVASGGDGRGSQLRGRAGPEPGRAEPAGDLPSLL